MKYFGIALLVYRDLLTVQCNVSVINLDPQIFVTLAVRCQNLPSAPPALIIQASSENRD